MELERILDDAGDENRHRALREFLARFLDPAFGALPKGEIELLVLNLLENLGAVSSDPGVYELVSKLRVTRTRARKLIYERELRRLSPAALDKRVKALLKRPIIQKSGELFVLEVENPLVSDHLRAKVQALGHISDGSFSPSVVKLPIDAIVSLVELYIPEADRPRVRKVLVAAGAPDTSLRGVVKAVLKKVASKVASETGETLLEHVSGYLGPVVDGAADQLADTARELFRDDAREQRQGT